jgi:hypothetical protein
MSEGRKTAFYPVASFDPLRSFLGMGPRVMIVEVDQGTGEIRVIKHPKKIKSDR